MELKINIVTNNGERRSYNASIKDEQQLNNLLWEVRGVFRKEQAQEQKQLNDNLKLCCDPLDINKEASND